MSCCRQILIPGSTCIPVNQVVWGGHACTLVAQAGEDVYTLLLQCVQLP